VSPAFLEGLWVNWRLAQLAGRFRSTRDEAERQAIAKEHAAEVDRLIRRGGWEECPGLDETLPDDCMPQAFFDYWVRDESRDSASNQQGSALEDQV